MQGVEFVVQHYTSKRYLTEHEREHPSLEYAVFFSERATAQRAREALGEFADAWRVEPVVGREWPAHYPGAFQHWPAEVKRAAAYALLDHWMQQFGPADIVKTLARPNGDPLYAADGARVPLTAGADVLWPYFLAHLRAAILRRLEAPSSHPDGGT